MSRESRQLPTRRILHEMEQAYLKREIGKLPSKEAQEAAWLLAEMGMILEQVNNNAFGELEAQFHLPGSHNGKKSTKLLIIDHTKLMQEEGIQPGDEDYIPAGLIIADSTKGHKRTYDEYYWSHYYSHTVDEIVRFIGNGGTIGLKTEIIDERIEISSSRASRKFVLTKASLEGNDRPFRILPK